MQIPPQLMTLPNQLTIGRILVIPVICLFVAIGWEWLRWLALLLYMPRSATGSTASSPGA
jgi:cardiolipin synthase